MFKETHITGSCFLVLQETIVFFRCSDELCEFSESVLWPQILGNKKTPSDHRMRAESPWMPRISMTSMPGHIYIYNNHICNNISFFTHA